MLSPNTPYTNEFEFPGRDIPAANWQNRWEYPELKPDDRWTPQDYLRLAWEIMRRSRRYRWHFYRLSNNGLLGEVGFPGGKPYISSKEPITLPGGWQKIRAEHHMCAPNELEGGETLDSYVRRNRGSNWLVVHGNWFARQAWGVSKIVSPDTPVERLELADFFSVSQASVVAGASLERDRSHLDMPQVFQACLGPMEALVRVRVDMPLADQRRLVNAELTRLNKRMLESKPKEVRLRETHVMSPLWLRGWDARASVNSPGRADLQRMLRQQVDALPRQMLDQVSLPKGKSKQNDAAQPKVSGRTFKHELWAWIDLHFDKMMAKARDLIEKESGGAFLADCLAKGLSDPRA